MAVAVSPRASTKKAPASPRPAATTAAAAHHARRTRRVLTRRRGQQLANWVTLGTRGGAGMWGERRRLVERRRGRCADAHGLCGCNLRGNRPVLPVRRGGAQAGGGQSRKEKPTRGDGPFPMPGHVGELRQTGGRESGGGVAAPGGKSIAGRGAHQALCESRRGSGRRARSRCTPRHGQWGCLHPPGRRRAASRSRAAGKHEELASTHGRAGAGAAAPSVVCGEGEDTHDGRGQGRKENTTRATFCVVEERRGRGREAQKITERHTRQRISVLGGGALGTKHSGAHSPSPPPK
jgi:hypothetical protein